MKRGANNSYFGDIFESVGTLSKGLWLTLRHIFQARKRRSQVYISEENYFEQKTGIVTLQYPYESLPLPDNGRYRLHNEIDDCIVCDKCAKICPVDCITIESIKATEEIGKTSDGTSKRLYAPIFDIDLAKCCYCGLCTTVCPTECLTMTKVYDFSEVDVDNFVYKFSDLTPEQAEKKRKELDEFNAKKEAAKQVKPPSTQPLTTQSASEGEIKPTAKPVFKPKFKPAGSPNSNQENEVGSNVGQREDSKTNLAGFEASIVSEIEVKGLEEKGDLSASSKPARPVFRPKLKPAAQPPETEENTTGQDSAQGKESKEEVVESGDSKILDTEEKSVDEKANLSPPKSPRPVFKPKFKPPAPTPMDEGNKILPLVSDQGEVVKDNPVDSDVAKKTEPVKGEEEKTDSSKLPRPARPVFKSKIKPVDPSDNSDI